MTAKLTKDFAGKHKGEDMKEDKYRQVYAFLVSQIDEALYFLDTGNLLEMEHVRKILSNALLEAEEQITGQD